MLSHPGRYKRFEIYLLRYNNEILDKKAIIRYNNEKRKDEKRFEMKIYEENT